MSEMLLSEYENRALSLVDRYLIVQEANPPAKQLPLLTVQEASLVIDNPERYYQQTSSNYVKNSLLPKLREGTLDRVQVASKQRQHNARIHKEKSTMYLDRAETATMDRDVCETNLRQLKGWLFLPVVLGETPDIAKRRVEDCARDIFASARANKVFKSASADRTVDTLMNKLEDRHTKVEKRITELALRNSTLKIGFWVRQFHQASEQGRYFSPSANKQLLEYAMSRPEDYQDTPNLIELVTSGIRPKN